MAVGEKSWPSMHAIGGIEWGVAAAGIKRANVDDVDDVAVMAISPESTVAGVFTRNAFCAEPVKLCKQHLSTVPPRYLVINSGNANACTGAEGMLAAKETCRVAASIGDTDLEQVLPFSTGVIGEILPAQKLCAALPKAFDDLDPAHWHTAAKAIMTTDTRPKGASKQIELPPGGQAKLSKAKIGKAKISITGICKGAGMIRPNMGTMLAFVATDAAVSQLLLQQIAQVAADASFNRITIDGDTSTNDAVVLVATGAAGLPELEDDQGVDYKALLNGVVSVYQDLAQQIVRDGEGATKFVEVLVNGGAAAQECLDVAYAIAHSPLVKTACFASDPNWGRIVAAVGYAGVPDLDVAKVNIWLDDVLIVESGVRASSYEEQAGVTVLQQESFRITVDLARGEYTEQLWTSDLSHEYIRINAEYRT